MICIIRGLFLLLLIDSSFMFAAEQAPEFGIGGREFLEQYCIKCHGGDEPKADMSLESFNDFDSLVRERKVWDMVLKMILSREMPPEEKPQPTPVEAEAFTDLVAAIFDHADRHAEPDPGRVTMRRLNRVEYRNTIRDLVGVDFDPTLDFPSDDIGHGFDNIGDVLTISPLLMERYIAAADTIMRKAIMPNPPPPIKRNLPSKYTEPASPEVKNLIVNGFRRMQTDGTHYLERGPIHSPYKWEQDAEYIFRARVFASRNGGLPLKVTILIHGEGLSDPSPDFELNKLLGGPKRPARILKTFQVEATGPENAEILELTIPAIENRHRMMIAIDKPTKGQPHATLWVKYFALEGPLDSRPASHYRLLATTPGKSQSEQTHEVIARFLRQAFRRLPEPDELTRAIEFVENGIASGQTWEEAVQFVMQAILCSPKFLFRIELDSDPQSPEIRDLDDFQLASRLSYFLWSSAPDDILLDLAENGQLSSNLDSQIHRMLADPRASSLVDNFAMQWLQLKRIDFISPDGQLFPSFDQKLRTSMVRETELFVESVFREDRSILDLIDAKYTFLNKPLASHYGLTAGKQFKGDQFQRINLTDPIRGGLLTQASVLTVTSNPTRTSPVKRGRWVLEQILGSPPPEPPPEVADLPEEKEALTVASLRDLMEEHRRNPDCASCHAKMDPIGFALENFNAVGAFRKKDGRFDIDSSGELPDGTKFNGPVGLKELVTERKEAFVRCLTERMLIYAIGRGLEYYDRPTIENIVQMMPAQDYKFSALITQIVQSDPFRQRRGM